MAYRWPGADWPIVEGNAHNQAALNASPNPLGFAHQAQPLAVFFLQNQFPIPDVADELFWNNAMV